MENSETILKRLSITMGELKAKYPTKEEWSMSIPPVTESPNPQNIKITSAHRFLTSNVRMRGMAFYEAYQVAMESNDKRVICTNVASMLCDVYDGFRSSVEEALHGISVIPTVAWLRADMSAAEALVWPFILINFGCCLIILLKKFANEVNYKSFMSNSISELKQILGFDADLDIPFDFKKANSIRENLGYCSKLRHDAIRFILKKSNSSAETDQEIGGVCKYLCEVFAWLGMRHFKLTEENLVKPQSLVLIDPRIAREVEAFAMACETVKSHFCPQFYMFLAPITDVSQVEASRFPTLIAISYELERKYNDCPTSANGPDWIVVQDLVKLHREKHAFL